MIGNKLLSSLHSDSVHLQGHPESKESLRIKSAHLFCCSWSLVVGPHGKCRDSCVHGCADWESCRLRGARCYSLSAGRWGLRLSCRRDKLSPGIVLLHDNARTHTARQTQALLREQFHWEILEQPPCTPELAWSDFFLFPKMKEDLDGKCFAKDEYLKDSGWITRRPHHMKRVYRNWCQGTTSALMSIATR